MKDITAIISTKDRYTNLALVVSSIINQTVIPNELIIFDDGEQKDLRQDPVWDNLFKVLYEKNIDFKIIFGEKKGQVLNHDKSLQIAKNELIWRIDDDNLLLHNTLENLLKYFDDKTGAIGGEIRLPITNFKPEECSSKIEDIYQKPNRQWAKIEHIEYVDHLHNSFLFRKSAAKWGAPTYLSSVGHREETLFTYQMKLDGWDIKLVPNALIWHLKNATGGIRSYNNEEMYKEDEWKFNRMINIWKLQYEQKSVLIPLDNGIGDHWAFKNIIPLLKEKYKFVTIAACFPEVFKDDNVELISIAEAKDILPNFNNLNIYAWMEKNNWKQHIIEAYKTLWL